MTLKEKNITNTKKTNKKEIKIMKKEIDINKNEIYTSEKKSGFMKNNRGNNFRQGFRKEDIIMKNENFKKENNKRTNDKRGKVVAEKYLNKSQFDAVKNTDGYVRVIAGAGTGKTRTLTSRYLYITKEKGISLSLHAPYYISMSSVEEERIVSIAGLEASFFLLCHRHNI